MAMTDIEFRIVTRYRIVFFPVATYERIGDIAELRVFGIRVYCKADSYRSLFGFSWKVEK